MRIKLSKKLPSIKELSHTLKLRFSDQYTVKTFGIGKKSILVSESTLVGAEISIHKNEVSIYSSPPSVFAGVLDILLLSTPLFLLLPFFLKDALTPHTRSKELKKEVVDYLKQNFS